MSKQAMIKTELGLLPADWRIVTLADIGAFYKGAGISREDATTGTIPAVRYGEIYTTHNNYIYKCTSFISPKIAKTSKKIRKGYVMFTGSGETKEDIGKAAAFIHDYEAYAGGDLIILSPKKDYDSLYLGFILNSPPVVRQRASFAQGDSVVHITTDAIKQIRIPIPPTKEEQSRIATALYDIDTLIRNLDRTIEKKKNIRQGAMEQLLSGKKRLPGFKGDWERVEVGEICKRMKRGDILSASDMNKGTIPVIAAGIEPAGYCDKYNRNPMTISVSGSGANAGFVAFHKNRIFATDCFTIGASDEYDVEYIYYVLKMRQKEIFKLQTGGAQPHVYPRDLSSLAVFYTRDVEEQRAIAATLTAMDDEIAVLQMERDKYANIRSGMMDDLLTGAKRI